jgi:fructokinase
MALPCIYAVGETVFDIIFKDFHPQAAKPGGSAFNAVITLGRLGIPVKFISEVGDDKIGSYILSFLEKNGVDSEYVVKFENGKSALSLAFLNDASDAEYDFYKDYPKQRLNERFPVFFEDDYFLFGSFYGLNAAIRPQITELLDAAHKGKSLVYYDPNFRSSHLSALDKLRAIIEMNFSASNIVRASDEDMNNIYGVTDVEQAWEKVAQFCDYFIYTANAHGVDLRTPRYKIHLEVDRIVPVSTIGAGDTFNAGILYGLYSRKINATNLDNTDEDTWKEILKVAADFSREVCLTYDNYISI